MTRVKKTWKLILSSILVVLTLSVLITIPIYAWFAANRINIYAPISTYTSLYIGSGHGEDIKYLYFDGVDNQYDNGNDDTGVYRDYVFSVSGDLINYYMLQLAYTTNNNFEFELYRATEHSSNQGLIDYVTYHTENDNYFYYTKASLLTCHKLDTALSDTYQSYINVEEHAEPEYWQTSNTISTGGTEEFLHYFILRIKISNANLVSKETDVICIAAREKPAQI